MTPARLDGDPSLHALSTETRPAQKRIVTGKEQVKIVAIEPVGNDAAFDDGHDSGLYSWDWLHMLGDEMDTKWGEYLVSQGRAQIWLPLLRANASAMREDGSDPQNKSAVVLAG